MDFLRNVLPGNFERYLRGIDFPIGKQELLRRLKQNGAPGVVWGASRAIGCSALRATRQS